jgi:hypothetical protein
VVNGLHYAAAGEDGRPTILDDLAILGLAGLLATITA